MTARLAANAIPAQAETLKGLRNRSTVGARAGNLVEWYDFFAYVYTSIYLYF